MTGGGIRVEKRRSSSDTRRVMKRGDTEAGQELRNPTGCHVFPYCNGESSDADRGEGDRPSERLRQPAVGEARGAFSRFLSSGVTGVWGGPTKRFPPCAGTHVSGVRADTERRHDGLVSVSWIVAAGGGGRDGLVARSTLLPDSWVWGYVPQGFGIARWPQSVGRFRTARRGSVPIQSVRQVWSGMRSESAAVAGAIALPPLRVHMQVRVCR